MQVIDSENFNIVKKTHSREIMILMRLRLSMMHCVGGAKSEQALRMNSNKGSQNL